jgi:MerR family copper efflux transcriptional regulator
MWKNYLRIKEAAEFLGVSTLTLRNWDKSGKLPSYRHPINNYRLYRRVDLENFLEKTDKSKPRKLKIKLEEE